MNAAPSSMLAKVRPPKRSGACTVTGLAERVREGDDSRCEALDVVDEQDGGHQGSSFGVGFGLG